MEGIFQIEVSVTEQILQKLGGNEHAQTVCSSLSSLLTHESLRMKLVQNVRDSLLTLVNCRNIAALAYLQAATFSW